MHSVLFAVLLAGFVSPRKRRVSNISLLLLLVVISTLVPASSQTPLPSFLSSPPVGIEFPTSCCFRKRAAAVSPPTTAFKRLLNTPTKKDKGPPSRLAPRALVEGGPCLPPFQNPSPPPLLPTVLRSGVDVGSHLLHFERQVFLWGLLTEEAAASIAAQLLVLRQEAEALKKKGLKNASLREEQKPTVEVLINCRGGSLNAGLALYDVMSLVSSAISIKTLAVGNAGHLGALILAAGKKKERRATRNTTIFFCESAAHSQGAAEDLLAQVTSLERQEKLLAKLLAKHTQHQDSQISNWMKTAQIFSAEEAKEKGIIDEVVGGSFDELFDNLSKEV